LYLVRERSGISEIALFSVIISWLSNSIPVYVWWIAHEPRIHLFLIHPHACQLLAFSLPRAVLSFAKNTCSSQTELRLYRDSLWAYRTRNFSMVPSHRSRMARSNSFSKPRPIASQLNQCRTRKCPPSHVWYGAAAIWWCQKSLDFL
jgi:hypothetical protein